MGDHSRQPAQSDYNYHLDRAAAERRLARMAWCSAARAAHHSLADLHQTAACDQWHEHVLLSPDADAAHPATPQQIEMVTEVLLTTYN